MVVCISLTGQPNHQQKKSFFYYLTQHQLFQHQLYHIIGAAKTPQLQTPALRQYGDNQNRKKIDP